MSDTVRCPDCGHENPPGSEHCTQCNFPLQAPGPAPGGPAEPEIVIRRPMRRPLRARSAAGTNPVFLWMFLGVVAAGALIWTAVDAFRKNNAVPVEGASDWQQREADSLRTVLAQDSTNVDANIAYANLLYDTANWAPAASVYARAIARDSSRVEAIVDMGVCWYNQGEARRAQELFQLALARHPGHPVALFNLGIVNERAGENQAALHYYHLALEANPPDGLKQQVVAHMQAIMAKTGQKVPPLPQGAAPPQGMPGMPPAGSGSQP
jgi:tetratricopeptide (TPR) repeat protein